MNGQFQSCLIITNPASASHRASRRRIHELRTLLGNATIYELELTPADYDSPHRIAAHLSKLNKNSLLAIAGGDGTINTVVRCLLSDQTSPACKAAAVLPLWGGNANDLAHMANGSTRTRIRTMLAKGKKTPVYPLDCQTRYDGRSEQLMAISYLSFGAVAYTAHRLNASAALKLAKRLTGVRLPLEIIVGTRALRQARQFSVNFAGAKPIRLYDILFLNGQRISKVYRTPASLAKPEYIELHLHRKHPIVLSHIVKLVRDWWSASQNSRREFTLLDPTWLQADGEARPLEAGTTCVVSLRQEPFYLWSTKL